LSLQIIRFKGSFQDASRIAGSFFIFPITVVCSVGCYLSSLSPQSACVSVISSLVNEHQTPLCWCCNRSKHHLLYRFRIAFFSVVQTDDKTAKTRGPYTPPSCYDIIKLTYLLTKTVQFVSFKSSGSDVNGLLRETALAQCGRTKHEKTDKHVTCFHPESSKD